MKECDSSIPARQAPKKVTLTPDLLLAQPLSNPFTLHGLDLENMPLQRHLNGLQSNLQSRRLLFKLSIQVRNGPHQGSLARLKHVRFSCETRGLTGTRFSVHVAVSPTNDLAAMDVANLPLPRPPKRLQDRVRRNRRLLNHKVNLMGRILGIRHEVTTMSRGDPDVANLTKSS